MFYSLFLLVPLFSAFALGDSRYMKAYGHSWFEQRWEPKFSKEDHCIYTEYFFTGFYRGDKEEME